MLSKKVTPKHTILIALSLLLVATSLSVGPTKVLPQITAAIVTAIVADILINRLKGTRFFFPEASLVTGLIISLVLPVGTNPILTAATAILAIASKQFLRPNHNHLFNPAAFGLTASSLIFGLRPGWWGDTLLPLTLLLGIIVVLRVHKELQMLGFLITYELLQIIFLHLPITFSLDYFLGTLDTWFFVLFMLPEPMTSQLPRRLTLLFGAVVALIGFRFSLLYGLLLANLLAAIYAKIWPKSS